MIRFELHDKYRPFCEKLKDCDTKINYFGDIIVEKIDYRNRDERIKLFWAIIKREFGESFFRSELAFYFTGPYKFYENHEDKNEFYYYHGDADDVISFFISVRLIEEDHRENSGIYFRDEDRDDQVIYYRVLPNVREFFSDEFLDIIVGKNPWEYYIIHKRSKYNIISTIIEEEKRKKDDKKTKAKRKNKSKE